MRQNFEFGYFENNLEHFSELNRFSYVLHEICSNFCMKSIPIFERNRFRPFDENHSNLVIAMSISKQVNFELNSIRVKKNRVKM